MKWIEASHLELWGSTTQSEADLPALLADLICATATSIQSIRFPSGGKGRTRGFDGVLECLEETLFVPLGKSIWELKTSVSYKDMALSGFKKRTKETDPEEQKDDARPGHAFHVGLVQDQHDARQRGRRE